MENRRGLPPSSDSHAILLAVFQFISGRHFEEEERSAAANMAMVVASVQQMHRVHLPHAVAAGIPDSNRLLLMLERMLLRIAALSAPPPPAAVPAMCAWVQHHVLLQQRPPLPFPLPVLSQPLPPPRPLVMCHNDLQVGNIILCSSGADGGSTVRLIDFEHSGPNMRAYDIANFLCELCFSYQPLSTCASGFTVDFKHGFLPPSGRQQLCAEYARVWGQGADVVSDEVSRACDVRCNILTRIQLGDADLWVGVIASHVYWGVWGLLQVLAVAMVTPIFFF